jgi:Zinc carboxypeptidase
MNEFTKNVFEKYENFKESKLTKRRFKQKDILPIIQKLPFEKMVIGKSFENREIIKIKIGKGKRTVLLWSQMHGNEATATMACFDIFRFFQAENDGFDVFRKEITDKLELHFIPMLNPDGAERFVRRTVQGIDLNRDAIALQCPESKILKEAVGSLKPEFSFNLHDQSIRYSVGSSSNQAAVSFLATAYNPEREWNAVRIKSRQLISEMNTILSDYIPGKIGRYSDEFEPRAFGDNIQKWGSSLVLIESGGYGSDKEKANIRKLNFVAILGGLLSIAKKTYTHHTLKDYDSIPQNGKNLFDIKVSNLTIKRGKEVYQIDMGINLEEKNNPTATDFTTISVIEDMGDLSVFWGLHSFDAKGGALKPISDFPTIMLKHKIAKNQAKTLEIGDTATFVIDHGDTQTVVINGQIIG